ncbi:MAG: cobalt-precorrin-5B (C(1))-methyltransferase [Actinomycetota bacterium]|nr:cobalt-precorrin-5B (C(1))-methyltransferase [Actinomycetota bacterium]
MSGARDAHGQADLREPDLPRSAKVRTGPMRTGWTTGTCAAAAAKAAVAALVTGEPQDEVDVPLPSGRRVTFPVKRCEPLRSSGSQGTLHGDGRWQAVVVKDAGDDPDCTHGAELTATVLWTVEPGVTLERGEGVGIVTKPGLGLEVGAPAINPVPRRMISEAIREVLSLDAYGVEITISVPGGEHMAKKTTNRRLGILGGISILGTSGIVRPFSTASWRASVLQAVDVMSAQGEETCVLTTGGRTERAARRMLPALPEVCFVEVGDFSGAALERAASRGLRQVLFVGMVGKLAKLGAGVMMTHWTRSRVDADYLGEVTLRAGGDERLVAAVRAANTARHTYELWTEAGLVAKAAGLLCTDVARNLADWAERRLEVQAVLVDFDSLEPVATSVGYESGLGAGAGRGLPKTAGGRGRGGGC